MTPRIHLFTSESVTEGHPDKVADQVSDAVLDAMIGEDEVARVACETLVTTGLVLVAGEVTTEAYVHLPDVVRETLREIGYDDPELGFDCDSCAVLTSIDKQSQDIALGVDSGGAGDQGMMFGYATTETPELMPAPIMYSHQLLQKAAEIRHSGKIAWLRPDSKSQVTIEYENGVPKRIDAV
ncbi:MAG: methionine adenosyltransferase, partial [Gemmatimonadetes bacterium]|nr:methionine adenosyltransferase [Gemmatimonadota bacterium]